MNYQLLHNSAVGVAFIGTVLVVIQVLREMDAMVLSTPQNLDIPGYVLVIVGSVLATWTAGKIDRKN